MGLNEKERRKPKILKKIQHMLMYIVVSRLYITGYIWL